jgi:hypothetical protein
MLIEPLERYKYMEEEEDSLEEEGFLLLKVLF